MTLAQIQTDFSDYLLDRPNGIEAAVRGDIAIYHHAYRAQLLSCLRDTFDKTWSWLGDERFEAAAGAHIAAHPPHSWTLNLYGEGFDRTLAERYPDDPEIGELAWLEWSLRRAFDGLDGDPVDQAGLAAVNWDNAVLFFVPTLSLGTVTSNCAAIWTALAEDRAPPPAESLAGPSAIRIWRKGLSAHFRSIDATEERALRLAMNRADFSEICALLVAEQGDKDAIGDIGRILGDWLQDGMIAAISDHAKDRHPMTATGS